MISPDIARRLRHPLRAALLVFSGAAPAEQLRCPDAPAVVSYEVSAHRQTALTACEAAADTVRFMAGNGFRIDREVRIEIVDELSLPGGAHPLGTYDRARGVIRLLSWESFCLACAKNSLFGQPADINLFRSVIAHEVAHAVAADNFLMDVPSRTAHEYIASGEISWMYFAMSPGTFGIKCYLHWLRPENGVAFLRALLCGSVRLSEGTALY